MKKSEFMLHAAMFDQRLLGKTCTLIVVTLLYGCQISVLNVLSWDYVKYKLKRSNADSFHHHLANLPNRKLHPNIRCRCGLDTVIKALDTLKTSDLEESEKSNPLFLGIIFKQNWPQLKRVYKQRKLPKAKRYQRVVKIGGPPKDCLGT